VPVHTVNPLHDPRWPRLVARHPSASVFHSREWLETLRRTYGYEPVAYTTSPEGEELSSAIVLCRIDSWLTGRRLVSLPFADHAEPLTDGADSLRALLGVLARGSRADGYRYVELRPLHAPVGEGGDFVESARFYVHRLDLAPPLDVLFGRLHKDCVQRKIRRAQREGIAYEEGRSPALLDTFYRLLVGTCRRRRLPPQPIGWFRHLLACLGDGVKLRVASKDGRPLAGILTLRFKDTMVYKYGCSDARFNSLGATQGLLWAVVQEAKALGLRELDLGRSDHDTPGLVTFKDRWGAVRSELRYARCPGSSAPGVAGARRLRLAKRCFARLPDPLLILAGRMLYPHVA
jgi:hypothetical protein